MKTRKKRERRERHESRQGRGLSLGAAWWALASVERKVHVGAMTGQEGLSKDRRAVSRVENETQTLP